MVIQVYASTSNTEEAEVEQFYEDLQDLLELTPKKDVLAIIEDWNAKERSHEIPGVTGKFGLRVQNEAGQRLTEFCQGNTLVIANTLFQQHKRRLYTREDSTQEKTLVESDFDTKIRLIIFFAGEGNGNPLQYSCLENPVDRGAWWAAVHRVAQNRT